MKRFLLSLAFVIFLFSLCVVTAFAANEAEPNNKKDDANTISYNSYVTGSISSSSDDDWYKVNIPRDGYITIDFSHELISKSGSCWYIYVYQADGVTEINDYNGYWSIAGNSNGGTSHIGLYAGTYYIRVTDGLYQSSVKYTLRVNYTISSNTEYEPNSSASKATEIDVNKDYFGAVAGSNDVDWYKINIPYDGYITVDLKHPILSSSSEHWRIRIYQSDGVTGINDYNEYWAIAGNSNGGTSQIGLRAGTYYIRVSEGSLYYSSATYTLRVNYTASSYAECEPNSAPNKATPIDVNKDYLGSIAGSDDFDWYKINIPYDGYITVDLKHPTLSSSSEHWRVRIYQSDGVTGINDYNEYWAIAGNSNGGTSQIGLRAGTYYIRVSEGSLYYSNATYTLRVNYTASSYAECEPNSAPNKATPISVNKDYLGSIAGSDDFDWYKITVPNNGYISVDFKHEIFSSTSEHWRIRIYQSDGVTEINDYNEYWAIAGNSNGGTSQIGLRAGTYYIRVSEGSLYYSSVTYTLRVNYTASSYTEYEPNSSTSKATVIKVNKDYLGAISGKNDVDWYKFTLKSRSQIIINFSHELLSSSTTYWSVNLYSSDGTTRLFQNNVKGNSNGVFDVGEFSAGTYYVKITSGSVYSSDVTYTLNVSEVHDCYGSWRITKEPTCTETGTQEKRCSVCDKLLGTGTVAEYGHLLVNWTVTKEASCTEDGYRYANCERCKKDIDEVIEKLNHSFTAEIVKDATLKNKGNCRDSSVYYYSCDICGMIEGNSQHTFNGDKIPDLHVGGTYITGTAEADHKTQTPGYSGDTRCLGCGEILIYGQAVAPNDHIPSNEWSTSDTHHWKICSIDGCGAVIESSVTEHTSTGSNKATCKVRGMCDECSVVFAPIDPANHINCTETEAEPPSCNDVGYTEGIWCNDCKTYVSGHDEIPATGDHTSSESWSMDRAHHWKVCGIDGCGVVIEETKEQHIFGDDGACSTCGIKHNTVTSFNSDTYPVTLRLLDALGNEVASTEAVDGSYLLAAPNGNYTLEVSKKDHATRIYTVTVDSGYVVQDVKIHLVGDINGDGKVNTADVGRANAHAKKTNLLEDYAFACADVNGDGRVNTADVGRMNAHAKKTNLMW